MTRDQLIDKFFISVNYEKSNPDWYYVRKSILKSLTDKIPYFKGKLLDVGCGIMPYREYIMKLNPEVTSYIGMDFENSISDAFSLITPDLYWLGKDIPLPEESVDTVLATEFFEHCPNPSGVIGEIMRVLKPGGMIFFTVPFFWNLHIVPYDEYRYTPFSLNRLFSDNGFISIDMESLGGWHASLAQMLGLWHKNAPASPRVKTVLGYAFKPLIKFLIDRDKRFNSREFKEGTMMTGISGVAFKPLKTS